MTEEWGFPYWLSYIVFGIATIAAGLVLGLIFVLIADSICPPKPPPGKPFPTRPQQVELKRDEDATQDKDDVEDEVIKGETKKEEEDLSLRQRKVADKEDENEEVDADDGQETKQE